MAIVADRVRQTCLALPEAEERETWERPTYRVRGKIFAMPREEGGRPALWCKAPPGSQHVLVTADPERFFVPPYVGPKGWIGMYLDRRVKWDEVAVVVRRSYSLIAPRKLAGLIGEQPGPRRKDPQPDEPLKGARKMRHRAPKEPIAPPRG